MISHQTLVGHLIPCLKTLIGACNLVTHESLVGVHASIGDHMFVVHSPNLHDFSQNPSSISYLVLSLVGACNLVTHESLTGVHASIGDHLFVVHSPKLHDCSPNPTV